MSFAYPVQKIQDWLTQQWVILWGQRINLKDDLWLLGPFGEVGSNGNDFITQLAEKEGLIIKRNESFQGLIPSINELNLTQLELNKLSKKVIDFYENTSNYRLSFNIEWNPFFKVFGFIVNELFSQRINQLNVPVGQVKGSEEVNSEIIKFIDPKTNIVRHTIWYRTFKSNGNIIFSGIYSVCTLKNGRKCVKAVFPLPKGNATVIMSPSVGNRGELILDSSNKKFGDPGFYFVLKDAIGNIWSRNHRAFCDRLIISSNKGVVSAEHTQSLWGLRVLRFNYRIERKL